MGSFFGVVHVPPLTDRHVGPPELVAEPACTWQPASGLWPNRDSIGVIGYCFDLIYLIDMVLTFHKGTHAITIHYPPPAIYLPRIAVARPHYSAGAGLASGTLSMPRPSVTFVLTSFLARMSTVLVRQTRVSLIAPFCWCRFLRQREQSASAPDDQEAVPP